VPISPDRSSSIRDYRETLNVCNSFKSPLLHTARPVKNQSYFSTSESKYRAVDIALESDDRRPAEVMLREYNSNTRTLSDGASTNQRRSVLVRLSASNKRDLDDTTTLPLVLSSPSSASNVPLRIRK